MARERYQLDFCDPRDVPGGAVINRDFEVLVYTWTARLKSFDHQLDEIEVSIPDAALAGLTPSLASQLLRECAQPVGAGLPAKTIAHTCAIDTLSPLIIGPSTAPDANLIHFQRSRDRNPSRVQGRRPHFQQRTLNGSFMNKSAGVLLGIVVAIGAISAGGAWYTGTNRRRAEHRRG
jgi:hypothetical protein